MNAFQEHPGLPVPCCVVLSTDAGVVEVPCEDQGFCTSCLLQSIKLTLEEICLELSSEMKRRGFLGVPFYISFVLKDCNA